MKKRQLTIIGSISLLIILAIIIFIFIRRQGSEEIIIEEPVYYPDARAAAQLYSPEVKVIKKEILSDEEREEAGFAGRIADPADIQVIGRDENGKITAYRKIYKPEDVLQSVYDPAGTITSGMVIDEIETFVENSD